MANRPMDEKSRAERIRARRQQSQKKPQVSSIGSQASRKQSSRQVPVTRRTTSTIPVINRKHSKVNVPLKTKGAELQLPAFPNIKLGSRLISGAVFVLSLAVVITFSSLGTFKVSAINLEGAERISADALMSQIGIAGTSIVKVDPEIVKERILENFPSISEVKVSTGLPASLTVKVAERTPLIAWQQAAGTLWIDVDGVMFVPRGEVEVPLTVIAAGDPPAAASLTPDTAEEIAAASEETLTETASAMPRTTPEFVAGVLSLVDFVPEGSTLSYDPQFGLGWRDPQGWLVYFGKDVSNIDLKLAEYETIVADLQAKGLRPALISLEYLYAPFYRLEQ